MILPHHLRNTSPWLSDFGRLFDTAFQRVSQGPRGLRIHEHDDHWSLEADFPGVSKDALNLEVRESALHLTIKASEGKGTSYRLPLGKHINQSGITAQLELGVLTIALPKATASEKTHRIEIQ